MWITQTYLGSVQEDASVFIYYLFANYVDEHVEFTRAVSRTLEDMGDAYRDSVSLQMPNPRYAGRVEAEVRENQPLWQEVCSELPGLLVATSPFTELQWPSDHCYFVSFKDQTPDDVARAIVAVRQLTDLALQETASSLPRRSLKKGLADSLEIKPGIWGISLDVKRLFGYDS